MTISSSSVDRPLTLRLRADLQAVPVDTADTTSWIVKDLVTLEHYQFSAEEYSLMDRLRRPVSVAGLQRWYERAFAPQTISPQAIVDFLSRLHDAGLLISDSAGQGQELLARRRRERTQHWAMSWSRLLAIRFRGIDPDSILTYIHAKLGWLFSKPAAALAIALVTYAIWLVVAHFQEFTTRLPDISALADPRNLCWLLLALGGVKILHELGHALVCKHFGGEVRELGCMLLIFVPCLYCDVSDAWRLRSKWQRIAVSAAGITVEIVLAALATIIWWHAVPGLVQLVAMNVMIVCTVNTLLVNGNPLMRYDGYYIFSDLVEVPNLWQRSREALRHLASQWLLVRKAIAGHDPLIPERKRFWLAIYGALSKVYMALVLVTIVWGLVVLLYPYHLQNLAYAAGIMVFGGVLAGPIYQAFRLARNPIRREEVRAGRVVLLAAAALAASVVILALPVNYYVQAPLVVLPADAARVYVTAAGNLADALPAGARVTRGDRIANLVDTETALEIARLEGEQRLRQMRVEHLERLRGVDRQANDELPAARAALNDTEHRLAERRRDAQRLTVTSPVDGVIIPAPREHPAGENDLEVRLATWSGSLMDTQNRGAFVEPGTLVCLVGDPAACSAVLLVNDVDVKRLQPGQSVRLCIDQLPGQVIDGEVTDVARHDVRHQDNETSGRADLAPLFAGVVPPGTTNSLYQARVRFELPPSKSLVIGGRGEAKVVAERITLARRLLRYFAQTFRLPM